MIGDQCRIPPKILFHIIQGIESTVTDTDTKSECHNLITSKKRFFSSTWNVDPGHALSGTSTANRIFDGSVSMSSGAAGIFVREDS